MNNLFKESRYPLMLVKFSSVEAFKNLATSSLAMHMRDAWLKPLLNNKPSSEKNLDDFL